MGHDRHRAKPRQKFGLSELGILDGPPLRAYKTIVTVTRQTQQTDCSAFLVFDDDTGSLLTRASEGERKFGRGLQNLALQGSLSSDVRTEGRTLCFSDLAVAMPKAREHQAFDARGIIASPVHGPAGEVIGVLAAMSKASIDWCSSRIQHQEDLAHLLSESILLRASMETLKLIASERRPIF